MRNSFYNLRIVLVFLATSLVFGCASHKPPEGAVAARERLTELESQPQLATRAPVAIDEARAAVQKAEKPGKDKAISDHLVLIAERKVDIAWAQAQTRYLEDQRKELTDRQNQERLDSRTREADALRAEVDAAKQDSEELKRQLTELNAKATDRGMVVTLGDVLFETGKAELKGHAADNLVKLSSFLNEYPDRTLIIEGHTDNVGSEDYNLGLSQRRADAVRAYLLSQGIAANRLTSVGKGESTPVASNDSSSGRQMNRRVEVIIANPATASQ
jgi:outer membrane protein OmpA-like peptidoglycan-associated protein